MRKTIIRGKTMNKSKKLLAVLMTAIVGTTLLLTGCGEKPVAADVTAKAFYNLFILGDSTEIEKIALTKDEVKQTLDTLKNEMQGTYRTEFGNGGLTISNEDLDAIYNAQMEALNKLTVITEIVSEDGDKATVKVSTNYVDINMVILKAQDDAVKEITEKSISTETEAVKLFIKKFI